MRSEEEDLESTTVESEGEPELPVKPRRRGRPPLNPDQRKKPMKEREVKKRKPKLDESKKDETTLFDIVKLGKAALTTVIDEWIESYKHERDTALLELIQFFIHCSGCKGRITPHMYANMEHAEIIRKMTEQFDEESGDYPLIITGPVWKKFKANFCEFIQVLVRQCQYSIIYDQYMMDNIISLLTGLTDSQVRAFRHTSTLASMKLMSSLVDVALNLSISLDHTQRQYESERQKAQSKRASERLEMLMNKRQEIEENQEEIRNMLTYLFKGVFVHRYRDTQPEIRSICMTEIGVWVKRYPTMFLDDSYLKYVGWTLYDRVGEVRLCCLRCLGPLFESVDLINKMELFINRFKDRIVEMTLDKEYDVAVQAVKLVIGILKMNEGLLSDKDCENVYELVYSSHRAVAQAAGEFLNTKLFQREIDQATLNLKSLKGKKRSETTPYIRDLIQFFIESELHEHGAYLVDALWEINDMLKHWECMSDLLLEEPGRNEEALDDTQETSLVEIMVCCVKQAATGEYPVGRGPNRKMTTKETKQMQDDKSRLTEHFIVTLPSLLSKYNADAEKVSNLLTIPQYFDLEIYTTSRQEKNLDLLLRIIASIAEKHTDSEVLENASKVLETFCSDEFAIGAKCNVVRSTIIDTLVEKYKESFNSFFQEGEEPDEDDAYSLMAALKRIYAFYSCHNLNSWSIWDSLFNIVRGGLDENNIPEEIAGKALACCTLACIWNLKELSDSPPTPEVVRSFRRRLQHFMQVNHELLFSQQAKLQEEAYITLCDLMIIFSRRLGSIPALESLVYTPEKNLQAQLCAFLNDKVFIEEDEEGLDENQKIEELHKRRNFLACFCKLIIYNVMSIRNGADMFKNYMKFYNDYGDIIKATMGKAREINKVTTSRTLAMSLTQLFKDVQAEQGNQLDRNSEGYSALKELARRFSLSFGLDQVKNREAVAAMHKEGILFSLTPLEDPDDSSAPPPNICFLEILTEFTSKLMKQDKKTVVAYLDKHLKGGLPCEDWSSLLTYRNSLTAGESDPPPLPVAPSKSGRRGKRKIVNVSTAHDETAMSGVSVLQPGETPARELVPQAASTAVRVGKHTRLNPVNADVTGIELGSDHNFNNVRLYTSSSDTANQSKDAANYRKKSTNLSQKKKPKRDRKMSEFFRRAAVKRNEIRIDDSLDIDDYSDGSFNSPVRTANSYTSGAADTTPTTPTPGSTSSALTATPGSTRSASRRSSRIAEVPQSCYSEVLTNSSGGYDSFSD